MFTSWHRLQHPVPFKTRGEFICSVLDLHVRRLETYIYIYKAELSPHSVRETLTKAFISLLALKPTLSLSVIQLHGVKCFMMTEE